ncbi:hypothetical protein F4859DRAFT_526113 [Xylaria cf. heliscus]|nr:hypothetical protein F4859DRAFT_526113 [Xylaria cf. heliscus]
MVAIACRPASTARISLCLTHYFDLRSPTPLMVTEYLSVSCGHCSNDGLADMAPPRSNSTFATSTDAPRKLNLNAVWTASATASNQEARTHHRVILPVGTSLGKHTPVFIIVVMVTLILKVMMILDFVGKTSAGGLNPRKHTNMMNNSYHCCLTCCITCTRMILIKNLISKLGMSPDWLKPTYHIMVCYKCDATALNAALDLKTDEIRTIIIIEFMKKSKPTTTVFVSPSTSKSSDEYIMTCNF